MKIDSSTGCSSETQKVWSVYSQAGQTAFSCPLSRNGVSSLLRNSESFGETSQSLHQKHEVLTPENQVEVDDEGNAIETDVNGCQRLLIYGWDEDGLFTPVDEVIL